MDYELCELTWVVFQISDLGCGKDVDGQCHLEGEIFINNELLYVCTRAEVNGEEGYVNKELGMLFVLCVCVFLQVTLLMLGR